MFNNSNQLIQVLDTPIMLFDGGAIGNPGEAAAASVLLMPNGRRYTVSQFLSLATNQEAEYTGLIIGLKKAKKIGIRALEIKGDSQLVFNHINGLSKVNHDNLQILYKEAINLIQSFEKATLEWIPREQNRSATAAVNRCLAEALGIEAKAAISIPEKVNQVKKNTEIEEKDINKLPWEGQLISPKITDEIARQSQDTLLSLPYNSQDNLPLNDIVREIVERVNNLSTNEKKLLIRELVKFPKLVTLMLRAIADTYEV